MKERGCQQIISSVAIGCVKAAGDGTGPKYVMAPQPLTFNKYFGSAIIEGSYHNPDQSHCPTNQYFGVYAAGGDGVAIRNNDCRERISTGRS